MLDLEFFTTALIPAIWSAGTSGFDGHAYDFFTAVERPNAHTTDPRLCPGAATPSPGKWTVLPTARSSPMHRRPFFHSVSLRVLWCGRRIKRRNGGAPLARTPRNNVYFGSACAHRAGAREKRGVVGDALGPIRLGLGGAPLRRPLSPANLSAASPGSPFAQTRPSVLPGQADHSRDPAADGNRRGGCRVSRGRIRGSRWGEFIPPQRGLQGWLFKRCARRARLQLEQVGWGSSAGTARRSSSSCSATMPPYGLARHCWSSWGPGRAIGGRRKWSTAHRYAGGTVYVSTGIAGHGGGSSGRREEERGMPRADGTVFTQECRRFQHSSAGCGSVFDFSPGLPGTLFRDRPRISPKENFRAAGMLFVKGAGPGLRVYRGAWDGLRSWPFGGGVPSSGKQREQIFSTSRFTGPGRALAGGILVAASTFLANGLPALTGCFSEGTRFRPWPQRLGAQADLFLFVGLLFYF